MMPVPRIAISLILLAISLPSLGVARSLNTALPPVSHYRAAGVCAPLLLLSHGFGGSHRSMGPLAEEAVRAGFDTWVIGHVDSGPAAWRKIGSAENPAATLWNTILDREFNIKHLEAIRAVHNYVVAQRSCRPQMVVLGGYSIGAQVSMIEAGAQTPFGVSGYGLFDAYVALSPPGVGPQFTANSWEGIDQPVLVVTGTHDGTPFRAWKDRLRAFDSLPENGKNWFVLLKDARHIDLAARGDEPAARGARAVVGEFLRGLLAGKVELASNAAREVWHR